MRNNIFIFTLHVFLIANEKPILIKFN